jgi:DNA-cytosine methyltransferase
MSKKNISYKEIIVAPTELDANSLLTASFFSGVRGLDIGAKKAGFTSVFQSDWWNVAGKAFELNIGNPNTHLNSEGIYLAGPATGDITGIKFTDIQKHLNSHLNFPLKQGQLDVVHGGPPCQDYSKCNNYRDTNGQKNQLIFQLLRIIREAKPKVGLIEQVPDLLADKFAHIWTRIKLTLNSMTDYIWDYKVINAMDHGARQNRKRIIIMLVRRDLNVPVSFPKEVKVDLKKVAVQSLLPHVYFYSPGQYGDRIKEARKHVLCTMTATGSEYFYGLDGRRRAPKMWERLVLTELEGLILTGIATTHQKKLVGNMVQVSLAEALFRHIRERILKK